MAAFEVLGQKRGVLLVSLAVVHFVNMWVFHLIRRRAMAPRRSLAGGLAPGPARPAGVWVPAPVWAPVRCPAGRVGPDGVHAPPAHLAEHDRRHQAGRGDPGQDGGGGAG